MCLVDCPSDKFSTTYREAGCLPFLAFLFAGCFFFLAPFSVGLALATEGLVPPAARFLFAPGVLGPGLGAFTGDLHVQCITPIAAAGGSATS